MCMKFYKKIIFFLTFRVKQFTLSACFTITMVCNHTAPKAESFARMVGDVPYVLDYQEILQHPEVEAVDIVLPIPLNYQVTMDALNAGKHVIVEKPLAAHSRKASIAQSVNWIRLAFNFLHRIISTVCLTFSSAPTAILKIASSFSVKKARSSSKEIKLLSKNPDSRIKSRSWSMMADTVVSSMIFTRRYVRGKMSRAHFRKRSTIYE